MIEFEVNFPERGFIHPSYVLHMIGNTNVAMCWNEEFRNEAVRIVALGTCLSDLKFGTIRDIVQGKYTLTVTDTKVVFTPKEVEE